MNVKQKIAALGVGVALLGGGSAVALATSLPSSAASSPSATPTTTGTGTQGTPRGQRAGALMRRVVHGDVIVRTKQGFQHVMYDRGTVTSKGDNTFTIHRPDNVDVTIKVDSSTKYRGIQSFDQLQTGKPAIVLSQNGTAIGVGQQAAGASPGGSGTTTS